MSGVCALIPAAGRGVRFGSSENKVFAQILGRPLLGWTLQAFADCSAIHSIVLIGSETDLPRLREIGDQYGGGKLHAVIEGGADRQSSVRLGLDACPDDTERVVIHDAARPCVTTDIIERALTATEYVLGSATAAIPVSDTLVKINNGRWYQDGLNGSGIGHIGDYVSRDGLWAVQTPQVFGLSRLRNAHARAEADGFKATDDMSVLHYGEDGPAGYVVLGSPENLKVTQPEDLALAEAILMLRHTPPPFPLPSEGEGAFGTGVIAYLSEPGAEADTSAPLSGKPAINPAANAPSPSEGRGKGGGVSLPFRIGYGYDVHPFATGRPMYLGGVLFPEADRGLAGHSDADALLHAVCDALLGAAGLGDIGKHFPPSDMRHKDRRSTEFLREVGEAIANEGWQVGNMDVMILAETPRVGPRVEEIKQVIADILGIAPNQISIKATTNEGMGFIGRGEGIAVHATALILASR